MNTLLFSFNAIFQLILIVALGYFLKRINLIDEAFIHKANRFCFMVPFPLQLFYNIYHIDFTQTINMSFILFIIFSILLMILTLVILVPKLLKDPTKRGAFIQGAYRSNFLLIGLPLARNLFGEEGVSFASIALPVVIPIFNFTAVIVLSLFANKQTSAQRTKINLFTLSKEIMKNPLIIASLFGLSMSLFQVPLPSILDQSARDIGSIATPLALILLGGQFSFQALHGRIKLAVIAALLRVILFPLVIVSVAIFIGFRGVELGTILIIFATPSALSGYIMAKNMDNDSELSGQIIILTTLLSSITLFAWVFVMRSMGFI